MQPELLAEQLRGNISVRLNAIVDRLNLAVPIPAGNKLSQLAVVEATVDPETGAIVVRGEITLRLALVDPSDLPAPLLRRIMAGPEAKPCSSHLDESGLYADTAIHESGHAVAGLAVLLRDGGRLAGRPRGDELEL